VLRGRDGKGERRQGYVAKQELYDEYVELGRLPHEPAKTWDKVTWEAFRHKMSRDDLKENFKNASEEEIKKIPLNWSPKPDDDKVPDAFKRAEVWEIFDKTKRSASGSCRASTRCCRKDEDPYGLEDFFPNAEPLQAVTTNDTLIPEPEFTSTRTRRTGWTRSRPALTG
jgi:hypothetical protein